MKASEMAHWGKVLAAKPSNLSLNPMTYRMAREN